MYIWHRKTDCTLVRDPFVINCVWCHLIFWCNRNHVTIPQNRLHSICSKLFLFFWSSASNGNAQPMRRFENQEKKLLRLVLILILSSIFSFHQQSNGARIPRESTSCHCTFGRLSCLGTFLRWMHSNVHRCARLLHVNGLIQIVFRRIIIVSWRCLQRLQFRLGK